MEWTKPSLGRGRGRGRARLPVPGEHTEGAANGLRAIAQEEYRQRYQEDVSLTDETDTSSSSDTECHEEDNWDSRGGSPRGMSPRQSGSPLEGALSVTVDYAVSRPRLDFVKKVPPCGNAVSIACNYYLFRTHPKWNLRLYSVKIEPAVEDEKLVRELVAQKREQIGSYLLTGLQLFTTRPINPDVATFQIQLENNPIIYSVELQYRRPVAESEPLVFQFYNSVVRQIQRQLNFQLIGRDFFQPDEAHAFPSFGLKLWPGFQNSIRQQEAGMMLNVESVWKVLQTEDIRVKIENIKRQHPDRQQQQRAINDELRGTMVVTLFGSRSKVYKIDHVDFNATPMSTFPTAGGDVVYMDYYRDRYNVEIKDPRQCMLVSLPKERDRRRGQVGNIYLVPELCFQCGLNDSLRSNFRLMKEIAVCLHMSPKERVQTMNKFVAGMAGNAGIVTMMKNWGIKLPVVQPVEISARMLKPDDVLMANNQVAKTNDRADWSFGLRGAKMLKSAGLSKWVIVVTNRDKANLSELISTMQRVATPMGYNITQPAIVTVQDARGLVQGVTDAINHGKGQLDFIMIILANNNADIYAAVKKRCSIDYGIPSQCFLAKHLKPGNKGLMSIATKVVIQMNAKQGGLPWGINNPLKAANLMVLGYDVHHAGHGGGVSVAAMTATMDETLGRNFSCTREEHQKMPNVGTTAESLFDECLKAFYKKNKKLPEKILMYRDGVGEGQLNHVYDIEIKAFKDRISKVYAAKQTTPPKLTYVVVNKRISTRFFQKCGGSYDNPKPGLVVDDVVTRPERYDFFLVSQTARQGCVSPTYYNVLLDEIALSPDKLQRFTFKMCHLYYNWSGTVAVPATCQNAHKLAFLVGTALKRPAHAKLAYQLHFL